MSEAAVSLQMSQAGYCHGRYAASCEAWGKPRHLEHSDAWIIQRQIPLHNLYDGMGCYPLFCCQRWENLASDFNELHEDLVALSLVTDPFGNYHPRLLSTLFDRVLPYKEHFVADLSLPLEQFTSARHRKYGRKVLRSVSVEVCADPCSHLDEWISFYNHLCERHAISGLRRFSKQAFMAQFNVPGFVMFRAADAMGTLGFDLWYVQGDVAYAHLVGISQRGYETHVSYGMKLFILSYFAGIVRWVNLGAVPGASSAAGNGLADFKRGWSSGTRTAYFCGKVFNRSAYEGLVRATGNQEESFFPAYRAGEFN
jgi:hypothetical protein